jgi:hypothetical protein
MIHAHHCSRRVIGEHSDLTIVCEGKEFKAHRSVLVATSKICRTMLAGPYKVI